jgi:SAM-dependent methyltransferase
MANPSQTINSSYEQFYAKRAGLRVYPTEFVVRTFLANYPGLDFPKPAACARVLDIAFGDGRNTAFLCEQGFEVSGVEITKGIARQTGARLKRLGHHADLRVGRNSSMPFEAAYFDCVLACHCCYYCDEGETLADNMREYARVMAPGSWLVASVASRNSYIFDKAEKLDDGSFRIKSDPYGNREGYRLHAFSSKEEIESYLSAWFERFSFGFADNDFFGVSERLFWTVCRKKYA